MRSDEKIVGGTPLYEADKAAVADTAFRLLVKSLQPENTGRLEDVFRYLWLRLDAAAEMGDVAVIVNLTDEASDLKALTEEFISACQRHGEALPPAVINREDYGLLKASGAALEPADLSDVDMFRRFVPFIRESLKGDRERVYFTRSFREEYHVASDIARRIAGKPFLEAAPGRLEELLRIEEANPGRNAEQLQAVGNAVNSAFAVITGGPGTGKTTSVANLLSVFLPAEPHVRRPLIALAAQTGKAAARMMESLAASASGRGASEARKAFLAPLAEELALGRIEAKTIDRWLVTPTKSGERPSKEHPLDAELLVVDEASMIDLTLAYRLFKVLSPNTRVILLGDANQLAAVGPGAVFAELCQAEIPEGMPPMVSRLIKSWRFPSDSAIGRISEAICRGDADGLLGTEPGRLGGMLKRARSVPDDTLEMLSEAKSGSSIEADALLLKEAPNEYSPLPDEVASWLAGRMVPYITAVKALFAALLRGEPCGARTHLWQQTAEALRHFRFLCASKKGRLGVGGINQFAALLMLDELERTVWGDFPAASAFAASLLKARRMRLRNSSRRKASEDPVSFPGEVIIIAKNDSGVEVANGDVAVVLPDESGEPTVARLLESGRDVPLVLLPAYETAFAMTIHKSQGSEFGTVGVFLPDRPDSPLAARELLYTGVTRAKENVRIFSTLPVLRRTVLSAVDRTGGLGSRLAERLTELRGS